MTDSPVACGCGCGSAPQARLTCHLPGLPPSPFLTFPSALRWVDLIGVSSSRFPPIPASSSFLVFPSRVNRYIPVSTSLHPSLSLMLTVFGPQLPAASEKSNTTEYANSLAAATGRTTELAKPVWVGLLPLSLGKLIRKLTVYPLLGRSVPRPFSADHVSKCPVPVPILASRLGVNPPRLKTRQGRPANPEPRLLKRT
ncbi:hypothetical protein BDV11DRAFT_199625 [Aspergillus similis]